MDVVDDDIGRELIAEAVDAVLETLCILLRPPVFEIPFSIELTALIVKRVGQLMADRRPGITVVGGVIRIGIVEGWLQDTRGGS